MRVLLRSLLSFGLFVSISDAATLDEFNDDSLSWGALNQMSSPNESGGTFSANITGTDPHFQQVFGPKIETTANQYLHVRMKHSPTLGGNAQLYWDDTNGFNGTNYSSTPISGTGTFTTYIFDLSEVSSWNDGLVSGFRLDPSTSISGTSEAFEIDWIRLSSRADDSYAYGVDNFSDDAFSAWSLSSAMGTPSESGGLLSGTATGSGDAFMARDILDVDGSVAQTVRIGMSLGAGNSSGNAQFFWTNEDGGYAGDRSTFFNVIADGSQHIYEIDMSGDPDWDGKTIDGFRIDPVGSSGDTFQIDFIEIVSVPVPPASPGDPEIISIDKTGATVTIEFEGTDGETYDLNKTTTLDFSIPDIKDTVTLSGTTSGTLEDTTATEDAAFYRVEQQ